MGQQQLLLIVLGVIIVGIAVVVGINLFNANAEEACKDGIVSDCTNLGSMAQQYYKKPASMGGGNNTFDGWDIPVNLAESVNGTYVGPGAGQTFDIVGTPINAEYDWIVTTTVTPTTITSVGSGAGW
jgi:hypothetical protein